MTQRFETTKTLAAMLLLGTIAAPALAQDHGGYGGGPGRLPGRPRSRRPRRRPRAAGIAAAAAPTIVAITISPARGVPLLYPELRDSPRGRAFVMRNFDLNRDGFIDPREARAADRAFDQMAHGDRAHFAWERRGGDRGFAPPPPPGPARRRGWLGSPGHARLSFPPEPLWRDVLDGRRAVPDGLGGAASRRRGQAAHARRLSPRASRPDGADRRLHRFGRLGRVQRRAQPRARRFGGACARPKWA